MGRLSAGRSSEFHLAVRIGWKNSFGLPQKLCSVLESEAVLSKALRAVQLIVVRPRRAWLMVRVAAWVVVLSTTARFCPLPTALNLLTVKPAGKSGASFDQPEIVSAVDAVLGLKFLVFKPICWKRASLLHRFLGQRGCDTTIVFGVRKDSAGKLAGHAWLENGGKAILESEEPNYAVTYRFPSAEHCNVELARLHSS